MELLKPLALIKLTLITFAFRNGGFDIGEPTWLTWFSDVFGSLCCWGTMKSEGFSTLKDLRKWLVCNYLLASSTCVKAISNTGRSAEIQRHSNCGAASSWRQSLQLAKQCLGGWVWHRRLWMGWPKARVQGTFAIFVCCARAACAVSTCGFSICAWLHFVSFVLPIGYPCSRNSDCPAVTRVGKVYWLSTVSPFSWVFLA